MNQRRASLGALLLVAAAGGLCSPTTANAAPPAALSVQLGVNPAAYPYSNAKTTLHDPWGFAVRSCASYAAWFLNASGLNLTSYTRGPSGSAHFGDAGGWGTSAQQAGWQISATPVVGAIAQWTPNETSHWVSGNNNYTFIAGPNGHAAVVTAVDPATGLATLSSYDLDDSYGYNSMQGVAPRYLLIGFAPGSLTSGIAPTGATTSPTAVVHAGNRAPRPMSHVVTGIVMAADVNGRRLRLARVPVTAKSGHSHVVVTSLPGGGFRTVLPDRIPWKITAKIRGYHCTSVVVPTRLTGPVLARLVCHQA